MFIYLIEALKSYDPNSVIKKWGKKHKHHPIINSTVKELVYKNCLDWISFNSALEEFIVWQEDKSKQFPSAKIILWISIHGSENKIGVQFEDGGTRSMFEVLSPLSHRLSKQVLIMQSVCWGGFPTIGFAMNNDSFGPCLVFGPTIAVRISALHYAERETLKYLATNPTLVANKVIDHIKNINKWGASHHVRHNNFYRAWFWNGDSHRPEMCPGPTFGKPSNATT